MNPENAGGAADRPWAAADLLWILGSLCQIHRIPFDAALVAWQYPPPHSTATFIDAASAFGFKVGACDASMHGVAALTFPLVAWLLEPAADGGAGVDSATAAQCRRLTLMVRGDDQRLLYFAAGSDTPETLPVTEFAQRFEPLVWLVTRERAHGVMDNESDVREPGNFGFRWFIPELVKHKTLWRDVLAASMVLQLVGLTTPLFTQVIIDKVVVHQTESTLIAIAGALVMFLLFNTTVRVNERVGR